MGARYFELNVRMENAAMQTPVELAVALTASLNRFGAEGRGTVEAFEFGDEGNLFDVNGNLVGDWRVVEA